MREAARGAPRHRVARATTARSLRLIPRDQLARVAGGEQSNLPVYAEMQVVGHTYTVVDGADHFQGGYWYPEPYWR